MKTILGIIILIAIAYGGYYMYTHRDNKPAVTGDNTTSVNPTPTPTPTPEPTPTQTSNVSDHPVATVDTSMGTFKVTFDHVSAPQTVENFVKLANQGFYNGLKFHRVVPGFVIQGGDPNGDGTGGPGYNVPAEIKLPGNKYEIGMASSGPGAPSNGSQFFIVTAESKTNHTLLDGKYTFFGNVTAGMDVVDKIGDVVTDPNDDMPIKDVIINKITIQE